MINKEYSYLGFKKRLLSELSLGLNLRSDLNQELDPKKVKKHP